VIHVWLNVRNSDRKKPVNASSSASDNIENEGSLVSKLPGLLYLILQGYLAIATLKNVN
jgi:hypothetical protein